MFSAILQGGLAIQSEAPTHGSVRGVRRGQLLSAEAATGSTLRFLNMGCQLWDSPRQQKLAAAEGRRRSRALAELLAGESSDTDFGKK